MKKYTQELEFLKENMMTSYREIYPKSHTNVMGKGEFDLVTSADIEIEKFLRARIKEKYPHDAIYGEEQGESGGESGRLWTMDPIDGTVNMARGIKIYGIQCALIENRQTVMSMIYLPTFDELFHAVSGEGAYKNGERIFVSHRRTAQSIVSFGDFLHKSEEDMKEQAKMLERSIHGFMRIKMFGAACMDFSSVACGRTDATVIFTKNLWDIAPGVLLAKEAGAYVCGLDGEEYNGSSSAVIAVSDKAHLSVLLGI